MDIRSQADVFASNVRQCVGQHRKLPVLLRQIVVAAIFVAPCSALAQSGGWYELTKSTINGSGATGTGGDYQVAGTVGQHSAADLAGGTYSLKGGFWSPAVATPQSPTADPSGLAKTRFISFSIPQAPGGAQTALRVRLVSLHHVVPPYTGGPSIPFTSMEGQVRWVGPPVQFGESTSNPTPFYASSLQCTPHYRDWSTVGLLHVTGSAIVPNSIYEVENVSAACVGMEASCTGVSARISVSTTRWADVEAPYNPPSATVQPDVGDISALVNKFRSAPGAPIKARALLTGEDGLGNVNIGPDLSFGHIAACVDAFRGKPYPFTIAACP